MEKDKKAMREKLSKEEEERQRTEEEMKKKLQEQQAQSENEIINLYKVKRHPMIPNCTTKENSQVKYQFI